MLRRGRNDPRDLTDVVKSVVRGEAIAQGRSCHAGRGPSRDRAAHCRQLRAQHLHRRARSISHRVKDEVEQATGLKVARVIVFGGRRDRLMELYIKE